MSRLSFALSTLALILLPLAAGADELVSVKAGYLSLSPSGHYAGTDNGGGTDVDFEGDLDFEDSEEFFVEAALQLGRFRLAAAYLPLDTTGSGTLNTAVEFNGERFEAGERVHGEAEADLYDIGLTFFLLNMDDLPVRLQLGVEVAAKIADADLRLRSETTGTEERVSGTAGLPTLGGRVRVAFADFVGVVGRVGYSAYEDNNFLDVDAQVELSPIPLAGVFAGYRYLDLEVDESDIVLDARFEGPYAGAFVRF